MDKTVIVGKIYDPILDCCHAGMWIETVDGEPDEMASIQDELLCYEGKRVRITIEEIEMRAA